VGNPPQRINYTCGSQNGVNTVLIGDFNTTNPLWTTTWRRGWTG